MHGAVTILTSSLHASFSYSSYQKDEREETRNLLKMDAFSSPTHKLSVTTRMFFSFFLSLYLCLSSSSSEVPDRTVRWRLVRQQLSEIHNKCTVVVSCDCSRQTVRSMQFKMSIKQQRTLVGNGCLSAASGRSCDRPADHFHTRFLASSLLQTNVVTVPKIPSCYWMFLMHPSRFKFVKMKPPCFKFKLVLCASAWTRNQNSAALTARYCCHHSNGFTDISVFILQL